MSEKRFVELDCDEVYYITDTEGLKTLNDYIEEFSKAEYEFDEEEALSVAKEEYWEMIYENSMSAYENVSMLNQLFEENKQLIKQKKELQKSINNFIELEEENEELKKENKRLTDKLNKIALELVDECISQGKASEISEMSYNEFLHYRAENGKPMELQK